MTREEEIASNDLLRTQLKGGKILMTPAVWELDSQLRGRALYRLSLYQSFSDDSLHDRGTFIFAGYSFVFFISEFDGERSLSLSLGDDWLGVPSFQQETKT